MLRFYTQTLEDWSSNASIVRITAFGSLANEFVSRHRLFEWRMRRDADAANVLKRASFEVLHAAVSLALRSSLEQKGRWGLSWVSSRILASLSSPIHLHISHVDHLLLSQRIVLKPVPAAAMRK
jgi:hypothetical protein